MFFAPHPSFISSPQYCLASGANQEADLYCITATPAVPQHRSHCSQTPSVSVPTTGGKPVQITGARLSGRGPGFRLCCTCFCPPQQYHSLLTVQMIPFSPSPSHSATDSQCCRLTVQAFSRSAIAGSPSAHVLPSVQGTAVHTILLRTTKVKVQCVTFCSLAIHGHHTQEL